MQLTGFVDPTKLTNQLVLWLRINLVLAFAGSVIWLLIFLLSFYLASNSSMAADTTNLILVVMKVSLTIFFIFFMIASLVMILLILYWVHQANQNVRQLGAKDMKFSPAAAVCWFFVPLANLYFVPKIMNELWKTSKNLSAWQNEPDEPLVLRWWWFLVIAYACSTFADGLYKEGMSVQELILPTILQLITGACLIISSLALISVVKDIYVMQMSQYKANTSGTIHR